jgi:hypothetical protein
MAKKQKDKPMLNLDGVEYAIEDMTDAQKELANEVMLNQNHVNDIKNKLANNAFMRQQLIECEIVFVEKHQKGVKNLKEMLEEKE